MLEMMINEPLGLVALLLSGVFLWRSVEIASLKRLWQNKILEEEKMIVALNELKCKTADALIQEQKRHEVIRQAIEMFIDDHEKSLDAMKLEINSLKERIMQLEQPLINTQLFRE